MLKKLTASLLISVMLSVGVTFAYDDVPRDSEYYYSINYLRRNDVFPNTKNFRPELIISKAEFIKYLVLLNSPDFKKGKVANLPFEDTRNNAWYAPYFQEAIELGIIDDRKARMEPYKKINVLEALELVFHSRSIPIPKKYIGTIPYNDVKRNTRSQGLVMQALKLGVVSPENNDNVGIYRKLSRERAAEMIYQMDLVNLSPRQSSQPTLSLDSDPRLKKIIDAWELVNKSYYKKGELDQGDLSDEVIRSLVDQLEDPYSSYLDSEENTTFGDEFDGSIEGIGAFIGVEENGDITIVSPIHGSPAEAAGVKAGDVILRVDGFDAKGATLQEVVGRIKGPKGTTVSITVRRGSRSLVIEVVRDVIEIHSLEYEVIGNGDLMHIRLLNFNQNAVDDMREVSEIIQGNPNIKGIILDVRNNPGGLLDVAINLLDFFLPKGKEAVHINYNFFSFTQHTDGTGELKDYPLVVLTNKGSASASEIVAGAIQDHDRGVVIGETSFGKGTVQELNYFNDNSSLKLTVAEWLTPDGNSIQDNGIEPDIKVQDNQNGTDRILQRAISEIRK